MDRLLFVPFQKLFFNYRTDMANILRLDPLSLKQGEHHARSDVSVSHVHDLIKSIRAHGQVVPIDVYRGTDGSWMIWDGCRRVIAAAALGVRVRARVMKPFATIEEARMAYFAANYARRNAAPSSLILECICDRVTNYTGRRRKALRWASYEFGITQKRLERLSDLWARLVAKDQRTAKRALVERWSLHEVAVAIKYLNSTQPGSHSSDRTDLVA